MNRYGILKQRVWKISSCIGLSTLCSMANAQIVDQKSFERASQTLFDGLFPGPSNEDETLALTHEFRVTSTQTRECSISVSVYRCSFRISVGELHVSTEKPWRQVKHADYLVVDGQHLFDNITYFLEIKTNRNPDGTIEANGRMFRKKIGSGWYKYDPGELSFQIKVKIDPQTRKTELIHAYITTISMSPNRGGYSSYTNFT